MKVIRTDNVNECLQRLLMQVGQEAVRSTSRNGDVLRFMSPVTLVHTDPMQHVLNDCNRRINPYLHFFEPLWILAGRRDVGFLSQFTTQMAAYSDDGKVFNAAYGYRIGNQLQRAIAELGADPESRQVNLQIWDRELDLGRDTKDKACNMMVNVQVRDRSYLDITVFNRSNDILWGAVGTNIVQFATLQAYMAAMLGLDVGIYNQVSCNMHLYTCPLYKKPITPAHRLSERMLANYDKIDTYADQRGAPIRMYEVANGTFQQDLRTMFNMWDTLRTIEGPEHFNSTYFKHYVWPMYESFLKRQPPAGGSKLDLETAWPQACENFINGVK